MPDSTSVYSLPLAELPDPLPIAPMNSPFAVTMSPPGSKSITNRAYVLAALAHGESRIRRPLRADDTDRLLTALCTLGADATWVQREDGDGNDVIITGVGGRFPRGGVIDLGDGGTPSRFMIAAACLSEDRVIVDGSPRMRERPVAEGVDMLRGLGADIAYLEQEGRLPVQVDPCDRFGGGVVAVGQTKSSQFVSALMLIAPWIEHGLTLSMSVSHPTSYQYILLTSVVMDDWGINRSGHGDRIHADVMIAHQQVAGREYLIRSDASSALYWIIATLLSPGSRLTIPGFAADGQPDAYAIEALPEACRDAIEFCERDELRVSGIKRVPAFELSAQSFPDGALALAAMAAMADGTCRLTGLHTLREKESDRISALAAELRRLGCRVETTDDSITINPARSRTHPTTIQTYNDHRIAMAFGMLGLSRPGISIADPACVVKSYPGFWADLGKVSRSIR